MTKNTKPIKREIRILPFANLAIRELQREDGTTSDEESRTITGTAIVFNQPSKVMDEDYRPFVEVIAPSAVTAEFLKTQDIKLNLLHDRDATIGRWIKGEGNLKLILTAKSLDFEIDIPKCDIGDRCLALVRAGVYTGCSFEFYAKDYTIEEVQDQNGDTLTRITLTAFESLQAITIAMDPAYAQTAVNARERSEHTPQAIARREQAEKLRRREAEAAAARIRMRNRQMAAIA